MKFDFLDAVDPSASPVERPALLAAMIQEKFRLADERRKEEHGKQDSTRDDHDSAVTVMLVTELDQIEEQELRISIERHDQAVIQALIENEERLAAANRRVEQLLDEAYVLPDGRRVFKTEDGTRVFDEFGQEVGRDELDPGLVDDFRPHWESFSTEADARHALITERQDLLEYQQKLDEARERMDAGDMDAGELTELDRMMREDAPDAVRRHLPEGDPAALAQPDRISPRSGLPAFQSTFEAGFYDFH